MAKGKARNSDHSIRPALSPENRENQLISLAIDCAEQQLRDGTASSQVITHYLKLGTTKHKLEMEKMKLENELVRAKTEALESNKRTEQMFEDAMKAFRGYQPSSEEAEDDPDIFRALDNSDI